MKTKQTMKLGKLGTFCGSLILVLSTTAAMAESVPESHIASPDVYKVLAENSQLRVILATWQPGQKDKAHSHPPLAAYSLTDCTFQIHKADGTSIIKNVVARQGARVRPQTKKHSFENISNKTCETLLVERKN